MSFTLETEREDDGRWLAEVPELPGVLAYGATRDEAMSRVQVLALRVLAESTMRPNLSPFQSTSRPHDILAFFQGSLRKHCYSTVKRLVSCLRCSAHMLRTAASR